jgi:hypothetical protein
MERSRFWLSSGSRTNHSREQITIESRSTRTQAADRLWIRLDRGIVIMVFGSSLSVSPSRAMFRECLCFFHTADSNPDTNGLR